MEYKIVKENSFEKIKKETEKNKNDNIIFAGNDDELNRKILEKLKLNVFLINQSHRKDKQKQKDSGFNQVMAKLAKKNNVTIGINLDEIIESQPKKRQEILARIKQNVKLCNKNKLKMKFIAQKPENNRNIYDLKALGIVLGMPTSITKLL